MKILESEHIFQGRVLNLRRDRIEADGRETTREFIVHPGAVSIVARPSPEEILLVRQYRHPTGETLIELPAGTLEQGENPIETACRELEEETGYTAATMKLIASYYTTPGFTSELMYLYEASNLTSGTQQLEDDESIEVLRTPISEAMRMLRDGEIRDAKTLVGLLMVFPR